ncbi:MAG: glutathione S-transferase N-terminal domain-containing protein [Myxococcota bacterium]
MIDLYSMGTPNGVKASIALEELELPYTLHRINIMKGDQNTLEYRKISPNGKIPAIVDGDAPGGPLRIMESGAILIYLARKAGQLFPADAHTESQVLQWLFFQVGHVGPMFGQFGHFKRFAGDKCDHPYPLERYRAESERLLGVLDARLAGRKWLVDDYSIADIATCPWVGALDFYDGTEDVGLSKFENVLRWKSAFEARPAVQRGVAAVS